MTWLGGAEPPAADYAALESVPSEMIDDRRVDNALATARSGIGLSAQAQSGEPITNLFAHQLRNLELGETASNFDSAMASLSESCVEWLCNTELPRLRSLGERIEFLATHLSQFFAASTDDAVSSFHVEPS